MTTQPYFNNRDTVSRRTPQLRHDPSHIDTAVILRTTAIVLLVAIAVIHIVQIVPTFRETPALGVAFILLIAGAVVAGGWLVKERHTAFHLWLPVAGLATAALLGYGFTRLFNTPFDRVDVGNWSCELGMAALFVEGILVAIALYAIALHLRPTEQRSATTYSELRIKAHGNITATNSVDVDGTPRSLGQRQRHGSTTPDAW